MLIFPMSAPPLEGEVLRSTTLPEPPCDMLCMRVCGPPDLFKAVYNFRCAQLVMCVHTYVLSSTSKSIDTHTHYLTGLANMGSE